MKTQEEIESAIRVIKRSMASLAALQKFGIAGQTINGVEVPSDAEIEFAAWEAFKQIQILSWAAGVDFTETVGVSGKKMPDFGAMIRAAEETHRRIDAEESHRRRAAAAHTN